MKVIVLISHLKTYRFDNHSIIPNALFELGHQVHVADVGTLEIFDGEVFARGFKIEKLFTEGIPFPEMVLEVLSLEQFDLAWNLTNPPPHLLNDIYTMLWVLEKKVPFVNNVASTFFLNNKAALPAVANKDELSRFFVSSNYSKIEGIVGKCRDDRWVLKPTNEGCGADVFFIDDLDKNARALIHSVTGNAISKTEMYGKDVIGIPNKYVIMQRYLMHVKNNEQRIILVGDIPVCGFRRFISDNDERGNVTLGTNFSGMELNEQELEWVKSIGSRLRRQGIYFSGLDVCYPNLLELNLANPGGFNYSYKATNRDDSINSVALLIELLEKDGVV